MEIGLDLGSGYIKAITQEGKKINRYMRKSEGNSIKTTLELITEMTKSCEDSQTCSIGITGINSKAISKSLKINSILDPISLSKGLELLYPDTKTLFDIGKESSTYYLFENNGNGLSILDFYISSTCSAGVGSLMDKMSRRFGFKTIDDFVQAACDSKTPAKISGRCSVFAESDVVHLFQRGVDSQSISSGLCRMLARNFKNNILKNKTINSPYLIGGIAKNKAVIKFLEEEIKEKIIVPAEFQYLKAIGVANLENLPQLQISEIKKRLNSNSYEVQNSGKKPLIWNKKENSILPYKIIHEKGDSKVLLSLNENYVFLNNKKINVFLGLDVGSVSTKAVLIDEKAEFIMGLYQRTGGKPIDAVKEVIQRIGDIEINGKKIKNLVEVLKSGTTGSGRDLAGKIIGANTIKNEITAQAQGATYFFPDVDTVFEIGGQDSKYIVIRDGKVIDNEMNKVCAASTGSFLEEQSKSLGIDIEVDFFEYAIKSKNPCNLSEKCAVFMVSSLNSNPDAGLEDRCAGLTYSICSNYLNEVAKKENIGKKISFQGAVAFNKAVVSGFETILEKKIYVPKYPHLTGAIGIAKICMDLYWGKNGI